MKASTVLVNKRSTVNKAGLASLTGCKGIVQDIVAVYVDGRIKTSCGDTWVVKPHSGPEADYVVVR